LMKPRYEIHSISLPAVISRDPIAPGQPIPLDAEQQQRAARALFSAAETLTKNNASLAFGADQSNGKLTEYVGRYQKRLQLQTGQIVAALERSGESPLHSSMKLLSPGVSWNAQIFSWVLKTFL